MNVEAVPSGCGLSQELWDYICADEAKASVDESVVCMSPATAKRLGLKHNDRVMGNVRVEVVEVLR